MPQAACIAAVALCIASGASAQLSDIRPGSLPDATFRHAYEVTLKPVNPAGGSAVLWSISPGCLDGSGLSFSPDGGTAATAEISGVAALRGTYVCTISAQDAEENVVSKLYKLSVVTGCKPPRITSLPPTAPVEPGVPYQYVVAVPPDSAQSFSALGLPPGLSINPANGVISGTTEAAGSFPVTISVAGCGRTVIQNFILVVSAAPVALALASNPNPAVFGQDIAVDVHAAGGGTHATGAVLLCTLAPGQFCAPPAGTPPPGTDPEQIVTPASAPLDADGNASFTLHDLAIQNYVLQAYYGGDATHAAALSLPVDQFVIKGVVLPPQAMRARQGPVRGASIPALSRPMLLVLSLALALAAFGWVRRRG